MWNEERIEQLSKLWRADELSASQIAERIGAASRSAVIGKAHRLGLPKKHTNKVQLIPGHTARKPKPVAAKPIGPQLPVIAYEPIQPADDVARVLSVLDLEYGHCRWPVQHAGGTGFCGCPAIEGKSWCPGHHARAHESRAAMPKPNYTHPSVRAFG